MRKAIAVTGLMVCVLLSACIGCGQAGGKAGIELEADQALRQASEALAKATSFRVRATGTMDQRLDSGQLVQISRTSDVWAQRPGNLFVQAKGDDVDRTVWFADGGLAVLDKETNEYATATVPKTIETMLDFVVAEFGLTIPVADLLYEDPYAIVTENVQTGRYLGLHELSETKCHHLAFRQETIDWQIWIASTGPAVPRKLLITYKQEPGHPTYSVTLDQWDLSAKFPSDRFPFKAPAGAKQIKIGVILGSQEGEQE